MFHFFAAPGQIGEERVTITGPDVNHMKNVLRMKEGEQIRVSDGEEREYLCEISELARDYIIAKILESDRGNTELKTKLYLFQGLPKGDKMEWIIQKAVELGVWEIIPVITKRTIVKLDKKKEEAKVKRWNAIAESAAKQSGRLAVPVVRPVMGLTDAFAFTKNLDKSLIPYEQADNMEETRKKIHEILPGMKVGIFIGPEGGFEESEIQTAVSAGISPITLGKRILRTETAGMAVLSILMFSLEE
ncbi:16S rRNA (uracil(1498)-N(3))-methyltransferase [Lachnospiraceae bacterium 62-35]